MTDYSTKPEDCQTSAQAHKLAEQWNIIANARSDDDLPGISGWGSTMSEGQARSRAAAFAKREKELKAQGK